MSDVKKEARPKVLGGITVKVLTGCGNMYLQMNWKDGKLFEIFATLGKTGGCATCESEAVTRSITMGLRHGVPVDEYIKQLLSISCPNQVAFPKEVAVSSCPDAIAKTLQSYGKISIRQVITLLLETNPLPIDTEPEGPTPQTIDRNCTIEDQEAAETIAKLAKQRQEAGLCE